MELTLVFKTEHLLDPVDNKLPYARPINNIDATPVRMEVFNKAGEFVAANVTYAPRGNGSLRVSIDGFNRYYGNPRLLWTNFYDTTDGNGREDSSLAEGTYQIKATVAGYYQAKLARVKISRGD
ncbi:TPA: hypothetical protein EYP26_04270 [Candidatus Bathyarchaeota archaeon]|nr:hypothetical protein [Candidatus Bathyarchaeota archaeon]